MGESWKGDLLDLIYPRRCPVCGKVPKEKGAICADCARRLPYIRGPRCMRCSKPILHAEQEYCYDCASKEPRYESGRALWTYDDVMRKSIARFKYGGSLEYADFYGEEADRLQGRWIRAHADVLVPVPLYRRKKRIRGYNQAEVFAREVGKRLSIPVEPRLLSRTRDTTPQKDLNEKERQKNLSHAFLASRDAGRRPRRKIMLVDDIYTTGSTIGACADALRQAGAREIYFLSICIGKGF